MLDVPTLIYALTLVLLAYWLVTSVFAVLAARNHFEISRHELLVKSKQMRLEYLNSLEERMAGVDIDDEDEPAKTPRLAA